MGSSEEHTDRTPRGSTLYRLARPADASGNWAYAPLYVFSKGIGANQGLLIEPDGVIYGTTFNGGAYINDGVYALGFGPGADGSLGITLWGTTQSGGTYGVGTVFEVARQVRGIHAYYTFSVAAAFTDATAGATIRYTTNGSRPTATSPAYAGPIAVAQNETVKAIAALPGYLNSPEASAKYVIEPRTPTPQISPASGTYTDAQKVSITVSATKTIKAIALAVDHLDSDVASAAYTIR